MLSRTRESQPAMEYFDSDRVFLILPKPHGAINDRNNKAVVCAQHVVAGNALLTMIKEL